MDSLANHINGQDLERIEVLAKDMACLHGLMMRSSGSSFKMMPVTLLPSPFPNNLFQKGMRIQKYFNTLFHKAACDHEFLSKTLESTIPSDDYIAHLWIIYETVRKEGLAQSIFLGLNRSDYMIDGSCEDGQLNSNPSQIKQVEFNLMSSGLPGIMQNLVPFHQFTAGLIGLSLEEIEKRIPASDSADGFAKGLLTAWQLYKNPNAAILFVVKEDDFNIFDQRIIERAIYRKNRRIVCLRRSLESLKREAALQDGHKLFVGTTEIAIVYFRQGYTPDHFPDEETWAVKLLLERSLAIKCPCVQYMLANTKKVQQVLSDPSQLQRFVPDMETAESLLATFVGQYSLDNEEKVKDACNHPDRYVLKPQREGGGNNFYNDAIKAKLTSLTDSKERDQFILMERIRSPSFNNFLLSPEFSAQLTSVTSELGIFGAFVGDGDKTFENYPCGYLLRTKHENENEGGISSGTCCIDTPDLI